MRHKAIFLALLSCGAALPGQTTVTIGAQTPNGRTLPKAVTITLRDRTVVATHTCNMTEMEPGETATCTVSLNQPARASSPTVVEITLPASGFTAPPLVTIPAGQTSATYKLLRVDLVAATGPQIMAAAVSAWAWGGRTSLYAQVMVPCCAREDRCGLPEAQISMEPCRP